LFKQIVAGKETFTFIYLFVEIVRREIGRTHIVYLIHTERTVLLKYKSENNLVWT